MRVFGVPAFLALSLLACGAGEVAEGARPATPTARGAMGESSCPMVVDRLVPLIVDWRQDQRGEIEAQMARELPVVAYDCKTIRLLPDCHIEGRYGYVGVPKDEQVVQLKSADEVSANLPKTGVALGLELSADLARGSSIDLALVMVGRFRTTRIHAGPVDLDGECQGATHFIRGAVVGAFAMNAGSQAKVRAAAEIFGGGMSGNTLSSRVQRTTKGSLEKCDTARRGDEHPPEGCDAVYRIELAAIDAAEPPPASGTTGREACPAGMVFSGGKCAKPTADATRWGCAPGDLADCTAQCGRGDGEGCLQLGNIYAEGTGVAKDEVRATQLFQQACDVGEGSSCVLVGMRTIAGKGVAEDAARGMQLLKRACDGGAPLGCHIAGLLYETGQHVTRDDARAAPLLEQACDGGQFEACAHYGNLVVLGRGVAADRARGLAYLRRGCKGGNTWGCDLLRQLGEKP
jgi:uncharacterized protein